MNNIKERIKRQLLKLEKNLRDGHDVNLDEYVDKIGIMFMNCAVSEMYQNFYQGVSNESDPKM